MGLDEVRARAERELEHLATAIEVHEADASPDAVLNAYATIASLTGMIVFSEAVEEGTRALRQAGQTFLHDFLPALGRTLRNRNE